LNSSGRLLVWLLPLCSSQIQAKQEQLPPELQSEIVVELARLIDREYVVESGAVKLVAGIEAALLSGTFTAPRCARPLLTVIFRETL